MIVADQLPNFNALEVVIIFGISCGLLAVFVAIVVTCVMAKRRRGNVVPLNATGLVFGSPIVEPGALIAQLGAGAPARRSLNKVIMTPTLGYRLFSGAMTAIFLWLVWGPQREFLSMGITLDLILSAATLGMTLYIWVYEVTYDADGFTAPNWFFQHKTHSWADFLHISQSSNWVYKLHFATGTMYLQKHLVGMDTFTTFVTEIVELHKRAECQSSPK